ncbi:MAG: phosphoglycolate phosphatase [Rubricoccaceae bacterium]
MRASGTSLTPAFSRVHMSLDLTRIDAVCFDIDGTLADTDDHLVAQIASALDAIPLVDGREASRLARRIVMSAETPVNAAYGALDRIGLDDEFSRLKDLVKRLRQQKHRSDEHNVDAADEALHDLVPGVDQMLHQLAERYPMSTISTGGVPRIEAFLQHYSVRDLFTVVVGAQTTPRMKPYPDPLFYAAEAMDVDPARCLFVGDTTVDMETAKAAGAQAVGVLCGFGTEDELVSAGADLILATTSDALPVLMPFAATSPESAEPTAPPPNPSTGNAPASSS